MTRNVFHTVWLACSLTLLCIGDVAAARFVAYFPLDATATPVPDDAVDGELPLPPQSERVPQTLRDQWQAYCDAWRQHHLNPSDQQTRNRLGLAAETMKVVPSNGRAMAASMRLPPGELQRFETQHFILLTDVNPERATEILREMERFHAVWTQLFFPLWRDRDQWDQTIKLPRPRISTKHRVVLFRDAARFDDLLRAEGPGFAQSTGFYSDLKRITFMVDDTQAAAGENAATRYHELTHQLLTEATDARARVRPGERRDFWLVEGIACYMESLNLRASDATVGGWQASRLQYARHRVLGTGDDLPLGNLIGDGRLAAQQRTDLARWYSFSSAYTHRMIDDHGGSGLIETLDRLSAVYQMRVSPFLVVNQNDEATDDAQGQQLAISSYLQLGDADLFAAGTDRLLDLCLTRTAITADGLSKIEPQLNLRWLDLSFLPIDHEDVLRLCVSASSLEQLSLEATRVDDSIRKWLSQAERLRELDLSSTRIGDVTIEALPETLPIETLWLTGSKITDASIDRIIAMKSLQRVDFQRTGVSGLGLNRLIAARPDLQINPLEIAP